MADWLDSADKVASVVGGLAAVAALVITVRDKNRRTVRERDVAVREPPPPADLTPAPKATPATRPAPDWEPTPDGELIEAGQPTPPAGPTSPGSPVSPRQPVRRPADSSAWGDLGAAIGFLAYGAGSALLGARLLSWLGGGSIGPWWLLAALSVSYLVGLFFSAIDPKESGGVFVLYILWLPMAAWLSSRGFVYYWFPDLFGNQGVGVTVVFVVALIIGLAAGFVPRPAKRSFSRR